MTQPTYRRRRKLIRDSFQLHLVGSFILLAALAMGLQFLVLGFRLVPAAAALDGPGGELAEQVPRMLIEIFVISMAVLIPLLFALVLRVTFRIAGPVYRFEQFLEAVNKGEETEPCKIREGDRLEELCSLINRATETARKQNAEGKPAEETRLRNAS